VFTHASRKAGLLLIHEPAGLEKWIHHRWLNHVCKQSEVQLGEVPEKAHADA
jgi:hypothetical protein